MINFVKRIFSYLYWQLYSIKYNTNISSTNVSIKATIGQKCSVRYGSEVYDEVILGDYLYISGPGSYVEAAKIGKYCSIARNVTIGVSDHNYSVVSSHPFLFDKSYKLNKNPPLEKAKTRPIIGNDVWIGMGSFVLRGVNIGDGAIVAANSVVTKDVEPYSIVAGSPARHLKYRFSPSDVRNLLEIKWWDWSEDKIKKEILSFYDTENFCY